MEGHQVRDHSHSQLDYSKQIRQLIQNVSPSGRYQFKIIVFFMFVSIFSNLQLSSSKLLYMNPVFYCQDNTENKINEVDACDMLDFCTIVDQSTVTAELHLYCDSRKSNRIIIQSGTGIGNLLGILFCAVLSDRKGRKFSIVISSFFLNLGCLIQYIGIMENVPLLLTTAQVIYGFGGKSIYINFLLLCTRFMNKQRYEAVTVGWLLMSAGIPDLVIAGVNEFLQSWKWLFGIYASGMLVLTILSYFVLEEDPIFYFDKGDYEDCKRVITNISNQNETDSQTLSTNLAQIDKLIEYKSSVVGRADQQIEKYDISKLLKCHIVEAIIILGLIGMFYTMAGSSIDFSLQSLKLSYNFNLALVGIFNIVGYLSAMVLIKIYNERKLGFLYSSAIYCLAGMMFAFKFCTDNPYIETILVAIIRVSLCWIATFYVRLKVDIFPEKYQAACVGIVEFIGNLGKTIAPFIINVANERSINPIFFINIMRSTIGTLPVFFLVEKKIKLESIDQLEKKDKL